MPMMEAINNFNPKIKKTTISFLSLKKLKWKFIIVVALPVLAVLAWSRNPENMPAKMLHQMYDAIKNIQTLRMSIAALKRVNQKYVSANSEMKLLTQPRKLYFRNSTKK